MSIILDALKKNDDGKKMSETQGRDAEPSPTSHSGVFMPDVNTKSKTVSSSNPKKRIVILLALLAVVALAAITFLNFKKLPLVATAPKSPTTLTPEMLAKISEAKKNKTGATGDAEKTEENEEDKSDQELEIDRLKSSAALHFQSQEWDLSAKDYSQLVNLAPTDPEARNNYGLVLKKLGKKTEAKEQYSLALALKEDYPEALNNMAVMHILDNNLLEAKELLKKAIELNPDYLDPYLHLALCLEKNGEVTLAKEYYQVFLKNSEGKVDRKIRLQIENRLAKLNEA